MMSKSCTRFLLLQAVASGRSSRTGDLREMESDVTRFRVEISESGTNFDEELEVDTNENTELYHVPQHNNVDQSDVLHMFALNLTIYRFPLKGVCHVAPLREDVSPPTKLVSDMSQANNNDTYGTTIQSSSYRITGRAQDFQLWNTRIQSFCRGFEVYHVEAVDKNSVTIEYQDEQAERERRQTLTSSARGGRCPPSNAYCSLDKMFQTCFINGRSCTYSRICYPKYDAEKEKLVTVCKYKHRFDEIICCITKCKT